MSLHRAFLPCIFHSSPDLVAAFYPAPSAYPLMTVYLTPITHHSVARKVMDMVTRVPWG